MPLQSIEAEVNFSLCVSLSLSPTLALSFSLAKRRKQKQKAFQLRFIAACSGLTKGPWKGVQGERFKLGSRRSGRGGGHWCVLHLFCILHYLQELHAPTEPNRGEKGRVRKRERERERIEQKLRLWLSFRLKFIVLMEQMFSFSASLFHSVPPSRLPSPCAPWTESIPLICGAFACNFLN